MKFLHTADWQLGARSAQAGHRASEVRKKRLEAVESVVELAESEDVDFVVIAGDTFEDHDVDDVMVRKAVRLLNRLGPVPVYVLPGNHDPLVPGGIWDRDSWKRVGEHVHLLRAPGEIQVEEGAALYPCPLTQKRSTRDPTSVIPAREEGDDRIRIGLAHGALGILPEGGRNYPIDPARAEESGLDYLALGDWHGKLVHGSRTAYSGTIEPTSFGEKDPGHVLLVEIDGAGQEPAILGKEVRVLRWASHEAEIRDPTDVETLEREVRDLGEPDRLLLRLRVRLAADADEGVPTALESLCSELEEDCFLLDLQLDDSAFAISREVDLPEGILSRTDEALTRIREGSIPDGPGRAFASEDEAVVAEAQALLHRLARGVGR